MVLDNADDSSMFFQPSSFQLGQDGTDLNRPLVDFIPQRAHGKILVTLRNQFAAQDLIGDYGGVLDVTAMNATESLDLFKSKFPDDMMINNVASKLLDALEHIPLAITQAGAYIRQKIKIITILGYLSKFQKSQTNQTALLNLNMKDLRRDSTVPNAVISTWEISFDQIWKQNQPAADFLFLIALFNRQSIPKLLLQEDNKNLIFWDAVGSLLDFSLVSVDSSQNSFSMHRLVQIITQKWLETNQVLQTWESKAIQRLANRFPSGDYENWGTCGLLLPYAERVITYNTEEEECMLQYASLLENTGWYLAAIGSYNLAAQRREQSLTIRRKFLHKEDSQVLSCMGNLAWTYRKQGRRKEAEELEVQVMETRKRLLGKENPETLTSMSNLASTYWNQGRQKEAEELEVQVMETSLKVLGKENPDTLNSMANLAWTYQKHGRWEEAEKLLVQVTKTKRRVLGEEHPSTLISVNNLASTYWCQGRWKEAEELNVQVIKTNSKVLGKEHPDTLTSIANLASTYRNQGRPEDF